MIQGKRISRTETHDRLLEFSKQADYISRGCQDCIKNRPEEFGNHSFYIFAHKREIGLDERFNLMICGHYKNIEDIPSARLIWSPRLTKPKAEPNSMLFKAYPPGDTLKVIWMLPAIELWDQYTQGKLSENKLVCESIYDFKNDRNKLEHPEEDDLSDSEINMIYAQIKKNKKKR